MHMFRLCINLLVKKIDVFRLTNWRYIVMVNNINQINEPHKQELRLLLLNRKRRRIRPEIVYEQHGLFKENRKRKAILISR